MVEIQSTRKPLLHSVTRLCAIIGGVFSVLGVVDKIFFKIAKTVTGKSK